MIKQLFNLSKNGRKPGKVTIALPGIETMTPQQRAESCAAVVVEVCNHFGCRITVEPVIQVVVNETTQQSTPH